jgi:hypothetical protein
MCIALLGILHLPLDGGQPPIRACHQSLLSRKLAVCHQVTCQRCRRPGEVALPAGEGGGRSRRIDVAGSCAHCHHDWCAAGSSASDGQQSMARCGRAALQKVA